MTDVPATTVAEVEAFARRHGLTNIAPEHMKRLAEITDTVSATGRGLRRISSKEDEPAHTFRVPQL